MNYLDLYNSGELLGRVKEAYRRLGSCDLCPHDCRVNRLKNEKGTCGAGLLPRVASSNMHRGEEPPISGTRGSGTIFLSGCSLACSFCQNFPISQFRHGEEMTPSGLAERMLMLQKRRAHNINFVTPTHFLPQILAALWLAIPQGFALPIVWNSSGYEKVDALRLLEDVIDIYLPDMKYSADEPAVDLSSAPGYREINRSAVSEMLRQTGHLRLDEDGIAMRGIVIRHLVLPEGKAGSRETVRWIAEHLGRETHIALMSQYFPAHSAAGIAGMDRPLNEEEYDDAVTALEEYGMENGWVQELEDRRKQI